MTLRLELVDVTKQYPGVLANDGIGLRVAPGEIHAVLGENGAGKSTLMKIIYGAVRPDRGEIRWDGRTVQVASPAEARALGISMVYQHFSLFDTLTAAENVWLGLDKSLSLAEVTARITKVAAEYGLDVQPLRPVHTLSVGERQRVEIVRALMTSPRLLILDEPTSVLTPQAVQTLFVTLRSSPPKAARSSTSRTSSTRSAPSATLHGAARRQVTGEVDPRGEQRQPVAAHDRREPPQLQHRDGPAGPGGASPCARCRWPREDPFGTALDQGFVEVRAGEIVGIAGVSGNGQRELMAALSGEDRRAPAGSIRLFDQDIARRPPRPRRRAGLHFIPEERLGRGAVPTLSLAQNTLLTRTRAVGAGGWLRIGDVRALAEALIRRFNVKAGGPDSAAKSLSGGNLQKFIVGREIDADPKLLVVSQPTWGVDVGAATQIRSELLALRDNGCAVLVVSEELDELFEICDRLVVIAQGSVSPSVPVGAATTEQIGEWMSGLWPRQTRPRRRPGAPRRRHREHHRAMLKLEPRPEPSRSMSIASPLLALAITVVLGAALFLLLGKDPVRGLQIFFFEPLKSVYALTELAVKATPLILIGLGLAVCFRSNVWNIGAEGQFILGAIAASGVAMTAGPQTGRWIVAAVIVGGVVGGMAWAGIVALPARPLQRQRDPGQLDARLCRRSGARLPGLRPVEGPCGYNFPQTITF
jgi:simple sugar transport system ATP-binding protein